jgi:hypothetical protein
MEDNHTIRLVDSVCVPSACSFLRCSATCSAVGKEWSHFGHVKPVSDIMCDWTVLDKKDTPSITGYVYYGYRINLEV